jgi:non-ribosomal peptide synthetase component F
VNLGGEALPRELVEAIYRLGTVERVNNLYDPSEDTTFSTVWEVKAGEGETSSAEVVSIGLKPETQPASAWRLDGREHEIDLGPARRSLP